MNKISIKTISIDKSKFYNVNGTIDTDKRSVCFNVSFEELKEIFDIEIEELLFVSDKVVEKTKNIYLYDENDVPYSCIECIFSFKVKDSVDFTTTSMNVMLENTISDLSDIRTHKVIFKTNYLGRSVHSAYISGYTFSYDSTKNIIINTHMDDNFNIDITIESKREYSYFKLSKIIYTYLEMLFLIFGDMPTIKEICLLEKNENVKVYLDIVDKYNPIYKRRHGREILGTITEQSINRINMKKFEKFRKNTKIIYDLLLINMNSEGYIEMKNCNLVQIMDGLYKTITGTTPNLHTILTHFFNDYKSSKMLLSRRDKRKVNDPNNTPIFIYKAKNHRNYLSHLDINKNKNVFYKIENNYAYWKLSISIRIYILEYLNIVYEVDHIPKYIEEIENWAKIKKMRFSLKLNN